MNGTDVAAPAETFESAYKQPLNRTSILLRENLLEVYSLQMVHETTAAVDIMDPMFFVLLLFLL